MHALRHDSLITAGRRMFDNTASVLVRPPCCPRLRTAEMLPCCWIVFNLILPHEALRNCFKSFRINKVCFFFLMLMLRSTPPFVIAEWCWCTYSATQAITGSSLRFTTNDLIRHQQVVTEAERGGKEERLISSQLQRGGSGGCTSCRQWLFIPASDLHTDTHTHTNKTQTHTCTHTHEYTNRHTLAQTLGLLCFHSPSRTTTGPLRECVVTLCAFGLQVVNKTSSYIPSSIESAARCAFCITSCFTAIGWFVKVRPLPHCLQSFLRMCLRVWPHFSSVATSFTIPLLKFQTQSLRSRMCWNW